MAFYLVSTALPTAVKVTHPVAVDVLYLPANTILDPLSAMDEMPLMSQDLFGSTIVF